MKFQEIQQDIPDQQPKTFLAVMLQNEEEDPYFIFQEDTEQTFESAVHFLASPETIAIEDVQYWQEAGFLVVCQTIDGDYIGGTEEETFVIPSSLYKQDLEVYTYCLSDFFTFYEAGRISSKILPRINE